MVRVCDQFRKKTKRGDSAIEGTLQGIALLIGRGENWSDGIFSKACNQ